MPHSDATAGAGDRLAFLSPEWLEALDGMSAELTLPPDVCLTLQQVVTGVPAIGEVRYHLVVKDGRASIRPGAAGAPDVTLTQPYEVAVALSRGEINAQRALAGGGLKLSGNTEVLVHHGRALAGGLADGFAALRDRTDY